MQTLAINLSNFLKWTIYNVAGKKERSNSAICLLVFGNVPRLQCTFIAYLHYIHPYVIILLLYTTYNT